MSTTNVEWGHFSKDVRRRYLSSKAGVGQTQSRISRQTMRTPPASPDLQSPPSNPAQGTGPGHVNRGGSDNRDRGAKAGVTHHCGIFKEHAATAGEEPSLKKPPETVRRNSDFAIPQLRSARPVRESNSLKPFGTSNTQLTRSWIPKNTRRNRSS